jgi:hypothetical protein
VRRSFRVCEGCDIGSMVGTSCWIGRSATTDSMISGCYGAGRAAILGDYSISVSLDESAGLIVIALVRTIVCLVVLYV